MCCLKFEQDHYEATRKRMPKVGKEIETPDGFGVVMDINVLKETLTVRIHKGDSSEYKTYALEDVKWPKAPAQPPAQENRNQGETKQDSKKSARRNRQKPAEEETDEIAEEMKPVDQSNDWLRAVEEALNAAKEKE